MRSVKGLAAAAVAAAVALSLGASAAFASHALSPERYASLDAAYTALIPLDKDSVLRSKLKAARRACDRLDRADPLLAAVRGNCVAAVRLFVAFDPFSRCRTYAGCRRPIVRLQRATSRYLTRIRSTNAAIYASVSDPACVLALRTSGREVRGLKRVRPLLRALARALRTGSRARILRAGRRFNAIDQFGPGFREQRARLRSICA